MGAIPSTIHAYSFHQICSWKTNIIKITTFLLVIKTYANSNKLYFIKTLKKQKKNSSTQIFTSIPTYIYAMKTDILIMFGSNYLHRIFHKTPPSCWNLFLDAKNFLEIFSRMAKWVLRFRRPEVYFKGGIFLFSFSFSKVYFKTTIVIAK